MEQAEKIEKAIEELARREKAFADAQSVFADAEYDYRQARATEFLKADGTDKTREAISVQKSAAQMKRKIKAEANVHLLRTMLDDCRQVLSARQSILSAEAKVHVGTRNLTA
jgi:uncharacterized tellurite resistance protein B-like protein